VITMAARGASRRSLGLVRSFVGLHAVHGAALADQAGLRVERVQFLLRLARATMLVARLSNASLRLCVDRASTPISPCRRGRSIRADVDGPNRKPQWREACRCRSELSAACCPEP
jgi:hypothetical protein